MPSAPTPYRAAHVLLQSIQPLWNKSQHNPRALCTQKKGFPEHAWKICSHFHEKIGWDLLQALPALMLPSPSPRFSRILLLNLPCRVLAAKSSLGKGKVGEQSGPDGRTCRWIWTISNLREVFKSEPIWQMEIQARSRDALMLLANRHCSCPSEVL